MTQLRQLSDYKGDELVSRVLALVDKHKPLHVSLVGGDPLVRYRELEALLPEMERRGVHTQVVTSAFREIPSAWQKLKKLNVVVSVDGLPAEHDERRKPATYERILKSIAGARVTIHCTITAQIANRRGYLEQFLAFWTSRPEIEKVWFSLFTPQRGANRCGDPDTAAAHRGGDRTGSLAAEVSQARHALGGDSRDAGAAGQPGGMYLCENHDHHLGRPEDANRAMPVRGRSRLRANAAASRPWGWRR